jgi:PEP-CTERM motif
MKKILAGLMLMASMGSAHAVLTSVQGLTIGFSPLAPGFLGNAHFSKSRIGFVASGQAFDDSYTFTLLPTDFVPTNTNNATATGTAQITWTGQSGNPAPGGGFTSALFYRDLGGAGYGAGDGDIALGSFTVGALGVTVLFNTNMGDLTTPDNYFIRVQGNYGAVAPFDVAAYGSGNLLISAVPEPSEWALMLSGLGLMGFMARRRRNAAQAV